MKLLQRPLYFCRRTLDHFIENPFLNVVTIGIITVTIFLASLYLLMLKDLTHLFDVWGKGIRVIAYLEENISPTSRVQLQKVIDSQVSVESIIFVSKTEALERFKQILKGNAQILENLETHNPLPESLEIDLKKEARSAEEIQRFSTWLATQSGVEEVVYGQEWVKRFATSISLLRIVGGLLGGLLLLGAIFIISNTIKITLFARKQEIEIMQLVGATDFFIKIPYVLEGSLQGFVGAGLALLASDLFYQLIMHRLSQIFSMPEFPFLPLTNVLWILAGGVLLGALASFFSVGRFLKNV